MILLTQTAVNQSQRNDYSSQVQSFEQISFAGYILFCIGTDYNPLTGSSSGPSYRPSHSSGLQFAKLFHLPPL